jgi:hypothetical protein
MFKANRVLAVCVVSIAAGALAAGTASATGWHVNGTELTGSQTAAQATEAKTDTPAVFDVSALPLKVACKGPLDTVSPKIEAPDLASASRLAFTECTVPEPTTCSLPSPEIETEAIEETITTAKSPADRILLKTPAKHFTELTLEGSSCAIAGKKAVTGTMVFNAGAGQTESTLQEFEGIGTLEQGTSTLLTANDKTYVEGGKMLLKLESGSKWSFH